ncbi:MAG: hypothetical protein J7L11_01150 [Thermoprotei archaeon]|nr:hypothetical protein [Thermoprotei archaeon]
MPRIFVAIEDSMSRIKIVDYAKNALLDELYAEAIYSRLAEYYKGKDISGKFEELAKIERRRANFWKNTMSPLDMLL